MLDHGGFEGNGQTLRIMARLEPYPDPCKDRWGMNPCRRTLLGILKYPAPYAEVVDTSVYRAGDRSGKPLFRAESFKPPKCYLDTEKDVVSWISRDLDDWQKVSAVSRCGQERNHLKTRHKSLDASIMEIADDIAYGTHDLEDAIHLRMIDREKFERWIRRGGDCPYDGLCGFYDWCERNGKHEIGNEKGLLENLFSEKSRRRKRVIGNLVGFLIENTHLDRNNPFGFKDPIFSHRAVLEPYARTLLDNLKKLVNDEVISSTPVRHLEFRSQKIVTRLFEAYANDPGRLLKPNERKLWERAENDVTRQYRVICDYIAGMTDEYATKRYRNLFESRSGSIPDRFWE